jgi:hypothetical protein
MCSAFPTVFGHGVVGLRTSSVFVIEDNIVALENVPYKNVAHNVEREFESDVDRTRRFISS